MTSMGVCLNCGGMLRMYEEDGSVEGKCPDCGRWQVEITKRPAYRESRSTERTESPRYCVISTHLERGDREEESVDLETDSLSEAVDWADSHDLTSQVIDTVTGRPIKGSVCRHVDFRLEHDGMGWCWKCLECGKKSLHFSTDSRALADLRKSRQKRCAE